MELNVVDQLSRRGYRFPGRASMQTSGQVFTKASAIIAFHFLTLQPGVHRDVIDVGGPGSDGAKQRRV